MMKPATTIMILLAAALVAQHSSAIKVEQPCLGVPKSMMVPRNCENCCRSEGYIPETAYFWRNECRCGAQTEARKRQEWELESSVNEFTCNEIKGFWSDSQPDGTPLHVACDKCCHEKSFKFGHFTIDHSFGSNGKSVCHCDRLVLKYVPPSESD